MKYIYRFNPFTRYWEILEVITELDSLRVVKKCDEEWEARMWCKHFWETIPDIKEIIKEELDIAA